ncbi:MAG: InlB B-repeat-containing protein [Bacteroidales bacterium]|nr:InlB B-repeat-containing protein [Bacteroidales bacterium]
MRRLYNSTIYITAALVIATSCSKVEDKPTSSEVNGRTVITAVAEAVGGGTKAHNQYSYDVLWDKGDQIYVTDGGKSNTFTVSDESAGTNKGKFTEDTPSYGITGDIEAFYPVSLKSGNDYVWPAVQTNNPAVPMYARQKISGTGAETVSFSSLGAMLQIVFNSTTPDITVTSVTIKDATKPLSGKFIVDENGQAIIDKDAENVGITLDLGTGVKMGKSSKYFYISIPAGEYEGDVITLTFTDSNSGAECVLKSSTLPNVARNTVGRITLSGSFKGKVPVGALPGKFTVNMEGKQVYFSKGNLQATYHSSTGSYSWSFATNQYDFVGDAPGNTTLGEGQTDGAVVSLFGWSTPATYFGIATSNNRYEYPGDFIDWGTVYCNSSDISPDDTWRTLSKNEWDYLLEHNKHGWATVNGIAGLVIAPDGFEGSINEIYDPYHLSEFKLVFLPAESSRESLKVVAGVGSFGHYYSGTKVTGYSAFSLYFYNGYSKCNNFENRHFGCSVRLVTDVNYIPAAQRRYTVFFYPSHDVTLDPVMVSAGATITKPDDPTTPDYEFKGWYKDFNGDDAWDFNNDRVNKDIVLFPKWERIPTNKLSFYATGCSTVPEQITGIPKNSL